MRSDCPLNFWVELLGDKWSLLIIRDLIFFDKHYYGEFLSSMEGISTNILADRLAMLEGEGFIWKDYDREHKQKIIYRLTEKGIDLLPVIMEIGLWSDKYALHIPVDKKEMILKGVKKNRTRALQAMKKKLYSLHIREKAGNQKSR
ncbi:MAG TPA: helix-turn-helix domain-containing protein [Flavisolibacter sp.]|nr:helix-turn-helix domain-containing protein [Flavisolibacter sp.]